MLWLLVILLVAGLGFVMFHKPSLNVVGAGWQPPRIDPPADAKDANALAAGSRADAKVLTAGSRPEAKLLTAGSRPEAKLLTSGSQAEATAPTAGSQEASAADVEDAITLRLAREAAVDLREAAADLGATPDADPHGADTREAAGQAGEWSAEDAVTAPMSRAGGPVVDGTAGQNAQPLA